MNPNVKFTLMVLASFAIGAMLAVALAKWSLFLGRILKKRITGNKFPRITPTMPRISPKAVRLE